MLPCDLKAISVKQHGAAILLKYDYFHSIKLSDQE